MPKIQVQDEQGNIVATKNFEYTPQGEQLGQQVNTDLEGAGTLTKENQSPIEQQMYYAGGMVNAPDRVQSYKDGGVIKPFKKEPSI